MPDIFKSTSLIPHSHCIIIVILIHHHSSSFIITHHHSSPAIVIDSFPSSFDLLPPAFFQATRSFILLTLSGGRWGILQSAAKEDAASVLCRRTWGSPWAPRAQLGYQHVFFTAVGFYRHRFFAKYICICMYIYIFVEGLVLATHRLSVFSHDGDSTPTWSLMRSFLF
jgi:hypothetical protein